MRKNLQGIFEKLSRLSIQTSHLSLMGKVKVINTMIHSNFIYLIKILPSIPQEWNVKYKDLINKILWGKKPKLKWEIITAPVNKGGLGVFDLQSRQRALHTQIIRDLMSSWDTLEWFRAEFPLAPEWLFWCNISPWDIRKLFPTQDVQKISILDSWAKTNFKQESFWELV